MTRVVILGAGPAGLGAAVGLARRGFDVAVVEQREAVGGNAGSFDLAGVRVDYGSHRLHPAADPEVLGLLRELLGDDLLVRPRHGRIRLMGRWIHFPLRPIDLALRTPPAFALGVAADMAAKAAGARGAARGPHGRAAARDETFASVLERGLGRTICRAFYFPYARKIWGLEPDEISPVQAIRRVSAGSLGKLVRRLLPGGAGSGARAAKGTFFYPRRGFGQISERLADAAAARGARLLPRTSVRRVGLAGAGRAARVEVESDGVAGVLDADHVWSTIPVTALVRFVEPAAPADVAAAADRLDLRAMLLVYVVLGAGRFTEYDAHYFPEEAFPFTRVSEPKNYAALVEPAGRTVLCAEIPCARGDALWSASDADLADAVIAGLGRAGLPVQCPVLESAVRRLPAAYPVYRRGFEACFDAIDGWLAKRDGLLSFGRQGLYAHDNTHHALFMAQAAVACLGDDGRFDRARWADFRRVFDTHVVED